MLSDQRIAELAAGTFINEGGILRTSSGSIESALRTAIRETQEACAEMCDMAAAQNMGLGCDYLAMGATDCADAIRKAGS